MTFDKTLWNSVKAWKSDAYRWVDLTHELSPDTLHWYGFDKLQMRKLYDFDSCTNASV